MPSEEGGNHPIFYEAAQAQGWETHALACGHDVMLDEPERVSEILDGAGR